MRLKSAVCIALTLAVAACSGGGSQTQVPPIPGAPSSLNAAPAQPDALQGAPVLPASFSRPTFPAALARMKMAELTQATLSKSRAVQSTKATSSTATGFFAAEQYLGSDAN